jgi:hypothetical protein
MKYVKFVIKYILFLLYLLGCLYVSCEVFFPLEEKYYDGHFSGAFEASFYPHRLILSCVLDDIQLYPTEYSESFVQGWWFFTGGACATIGCLVVCVAIIVKFLSKKSKEEPILHS